MTLREQLDVLRDPDMLHIKNSEGRTLYIGYKGTMEHFIGNDGGLDEQDLKKTVKEFRAVPEIRHKNYREMGLMEPMQPQETPQWSFSDLMMTLYNTITIQ